MLINVIQVFTKTYEKKLDLVGPIKLLFYILLYAELNKLFYFYWIYVKVQQFIHMLGNKPNWWESHRKDSMSQYIFYILKMKKKLIGLNYLNSLNYVSIAKELVRQAQIQVVLSCRIIYTVDLKLPYQMHGAWKRICFYKVPSLLL